MPFIVTLLFPTLISPHTKTWLLTYLLSSKCPKRLFYFHRRASVWLCQWSNAKMVFCILALEWTPLPEKPTFSTTEYGLKSNAVKLAMDLVIRFFLSEFGWSCATACSIILWLASATDRCFSPNSGWHHTRWFQKFVVLLKYLSWVPCTLQTV